MCAQKLPFSTVLFYGYPTFPTTSIFLVYSFVEERHVSLDLDGSLPRALVPPRHFMPMISLRGDREIVFALFM